MTPVNPKSAQKRYPKKWHIPVHQHMEVTPLPPPPPPPGFKLSQLSNYVCFCYGISVHENNYDTSRRQKRFHTIRSRNTLQIFAVNTVELEKSEDCDFSCIKLALQKVSVSRKYKSNQEITTILCEFVC